MSCNLTEDSCAGAPRVGTKGRTRSFDREWESTSPLLQCDAVLGRDVKSVAYHYLGTLCGSEALPLL
jgi:hypothetical protein